MELTITEEERKLIMPITAPAFVSLALTNDFFSWQKEYDQFKREAKAPYMVNAIWILMQEHSIDIERAKQMLKDKIAGYCQEYLRLTTEFRSSKVVSLDVQRYLSALELSIAGNVGWSQFTPRYNFATDSPKKAVNGLQNGLHSRKNGANGQYSAVESHVNEDEQSQTGLLSPPISSVCGKCRDQMMTGPEDQVQEFSSFPPSEVDPGEKDMVPKILSKVGRREDRAIVTCRSLSVLSDEASHPVLWSVNFLGS